MLTNAECLVRATAMDARAVQGPEVCSEMFRLLADGWRTTARAALWQDEWQLNNEIEVLDFDR
jgi:hypothetical protein